MVPDAEESKEFWSGIWDVPVEHNKNAEWLKKLENHTRDVPKQLNVKFEINSLKQKLKKCQTGKALAQMGCKDIGSKTLHTCMSE